MTVMASTPSRLCLFGEHLDYHSLEVITMAIDLSFYARISKRNDGLAVIKIKDESIDTLNQDNSGNKYEIYEYDLRTPLVYENTRDYFKSCFNVIKNRGCDISCGFDITMDSEIPIGKGMCSSSTMIVVLIKGVLETLDCELKDDRMEIAQMGYEAEVAEFNEPGGKMDHMASAFGGVCHFDFADIRNPVMNRFDGLPQGGFVLFDTLKRKDTIRVLATARKPVEEAVRKLGVKSIGELSEEEIFESGLDESLTRPSVAAIRNYKILREFLRLYNSGNLSPEKFGEMLYEHHKNLRDGLGISTNEIEEILDTAISAGALGGKLNGTGGGGCCYVFADEDKLKAIVEAVESKGYPGRIIHTADGVSAYGRD
jgi:galactokinase